MIQILQLHSSGLSLDDRFPVHMNRLWMKNYHGTDAFLYHIEETVVTVSGGGTVILANDFMPVVPVITATSETTLSWAIDGESFQKTVSAGTWEIPELELRHGNNTVSVTNEGTTTFVYREGRL